MNFSKFSNESNSWNTIWPLLRKSNLDSEFLQGFVSIVDPDLIVSISLRGELMKFFKMERIEGLGSATLFSIATKTKRIHTIDGYHYSAPNVSDEADIFAPIKGYMEGYRRE